MDVLQPSDESRVLIIYTGGTIGMLVGHQGYVPEPYFLTQTLRSQSRFHDPFQDSLFSHSGSVQGFRQWTSGSGTSTPTPTPTPSTFETPVPTRSPPTLLVRSSRPIGQSDIDSLLAPTCTKVADDIYEAHLPSLVTPRSTVPGGGGSKRIRYAVLEWNPLLDSSNIEIDDWIRISTEIELNYAYFDSFVVLHGTDTMSYTSSALSFLLEDLGKTVIVTGAQIPLSQLRNDAVENLLGALSVAGHYIIPECSLYFNHTLYRGNRVSKVSSYDFNAFNSPNFPPLVNVGIDIIVNWNDVIRQTSLKRFRAHKQMNPHVATLRLFPGISAATIRSFLSPPIQGVVLETFGAGNAPQRADLMLALKEACDRGVIVVAISQCAKGSVSDAYETGRTLLKAGVVPGGDMTPECALTKLGYLLSKPELSTTEIRDLISIPLRGELTRTRTRPSASGATPSRPTIDQDLEHIHSLLSHFGRLSTDSRAPSQITLKHKPISKITLSPSLGLGLGLGETAQDAAAPWSWTSSEAVSTEAVLFPFLIHLAAARDDAESMIFCLNTAATNDSAVTSTSTSTSTSPSPSPTMQNQNQNQNQSQNHNHNRHRQPWNIPGGIVNCLDPASGRSPLHVAALNGSVRCLGMLLESGGLVHLRDSLGHTALYYAARQGHEDAVDALVRAGANLGGFDYEGGFAMLAVRTAIRTNDGVSLRIWMKTGMKMPEEYKDAFDSSRSLDADAKGPTKM